YSVYVDGQLAFSQDSESCSTTGMEDHFFQPGCVFWGDQSTAPGASADWDYVRITAKPLAPLVNQPPTAYDQEVTVDQNQSVDITLRASDPDEQPLAYEVVTGPQHGELAIQDAPIGKIVRYKAAPGYSGQDSFTFRATDGSAYSNTATVTVTVIPALDYALLAGTALGRARFMEQIAPYFLYDTETPSNPGLKDDPLWYKDSEARQAWVDLGEPAPFWTPQDPALFLKEATQMLWLSAAKVALKAFPGYGLPVRVEVRDYSDDETRKRVSLYKMVDAQALDAFLLSGARKVDEKALDTLIQILERNLSSPVLTVLATACRETARLFGWLSMASGMVEDAKNIIDAAFQLPNDSITMYRIAQLWGSTLGGAQLKPVLLDLARLHMLVKQEAALWSYRARGEREVDGKSVIGELRRNLQSQLEILRDKEYTIAFNSVWGGGARIDATGLADLLARRDNSLIAQIPSSSYPYIDRPWWKSIEEGWCFRFSTEPDYVKGLLDQIPQPASSSLAIVVPETPATYGQTVPLRARLTTSGGAPIPGKSLTFRILRSDGSELAVPSGTTGLKADGTPTQDPGQAECLVKIESDYPAPTQPLTVSVTFDGDDDYNACTAEAQLPLRPSATSLTAQSDFASVGAAQVKLMAALTHEAGDGLAGKALTVSVNNGPVQTMDQTSSSGVTAKTFDLPLTTEPGEIPYTVTFAGDDRYLASEVSGTIVVGEAGERIPTEVEAFDAVVHCWGRTTLRAIVRRADPHVGVVGLGVRFYVDGSCVGSGVSAAADSGATPPREDGEARLLYDVHREWWPGEHTLVAEFGGNAVCAPSVSEQKTLSVIKSISTIVL
ncbi:MAG: hypothetical protein GX446_15880, partial [Chthonomonadales bacterium]|nr:hypothetical protein [Chthonomonadales bacterium]